jgi:hypothetical protein
MPMTEKQFEKFVDFGDLEKSLIMPRVVNPLPMPAGAAVPRTPQTQRPAHIPQAEPAQPAAAQSR